MRRSSTPLLLLLCSALLTPLAVADEGAGELEALRALHDELAGGVFGLISGGEPEEVFEGWGFESDAASREVIAGLRKLHEERPWTRARPLGFNWTLVLEKDGRPVQRIRAFVAFADGEAALMSLSATKADDGEVEAEGAVALKALPETRSGRMLKRAAEAILAGLQPGSERPLPIITLERYARFHPKARDPEARAKSHATLVKTLAARLDGLVIEAHDSVRVALGPSAVNVDAKGPERGMLFLKVSPDAEKGARIALSKLRVQAD